jgi:hypothetical protein
MRNDIKRQLEAMESGECRWIRREDIHAYCLKPKGKQPRFRVVTMERPYQSQEWVSLDQTAETILEIELCAA